MNLRFKDRGKSVKTGKKILCKFCANAMHKKMHRGVKLYKSLILRGNL